MLVAHESASSRPLGFYADKRRALRRSPDPLPVFPPFSLPCPNIISFCPANFKSRSDFCACNWYTIFPCFLQRPQLLADVGSLRRVFSPQLSGDRDFSGTRGEKRGSMPSVFHDRGLTESPSDSFLPMSLQSRKFRPALQRSTFQSPPTSCFWMSNHFASNTHHRCFFTDSLYRYFHTEWTVFIPVFYSFGVVSYFSSFPLVSSADCIFSTPTNPAEACYLCCLGEGSFFFFFFAIRAPSFRQS